MNKYNHWYSNIIENARNRIVVGYKETHHIVPRSLGGTDDKENLVDLTAREHFICHWLLVKIHTGKARHKMVYALNGMKRNGKDNQRYETPITSRVYEKLKVEFGAVHSLTMTGKPAHNKGRKMSEEQKAKIRATKAANPYTPTPEAVAKRLEKIVGQKRSEETKRKISEALKGKLKGPMSDSEKLKRSVTASGKTKPAGFGNKVAKRMKESFTKNNPNRRDDLKQVCPYCSLKVGPSNFSRWHGDRCRQR
jgi:hypothetical protein